MSRKAYPTDLSDIEWLILEPLLLAILPQRKRERKREVDLREIVNAIFYVLRSGCSWRMLPHDLPAWQTVYGYFRRWRQSGVWEQLNDALVETVRIEAGRGADPTVAIVDSQSVKTTAVAGERGFDGAKDVTLNTLPSGCSKDYEVLPETSQAFIYAAMVNLMLRRLARNPAIYC